MEVIQKIPGHHIGRAQSQGSTEHRHSEHRTYQSESANVKVQNFQHGK